MSGIRGQSIGSFTPFWVTLFRAIASSSHEVGYRKKGVRHLQAHTIAPALVMLLGAIVGYRILQP